MNATAIEWTDLSWNPTRGCSRVSPGCVNCYAERQAARFSGLTPATRNPKASFAGFATMRGNLPRWTGRVEAVESKLTEPLGRRRWAEKFLREHGRKPRVFVNSMSDLFHEALTDEQIDRVFAVMALAPRFDFLVLTKRAERMAQYLSAHDVGLRWLLALPRGRDADAMTYQETDAVEWSRRGLPHVRLGVSVEDQSRWNEQAPHLMTVAEQGWHTVVSFEPLLGPVKVLACEWQAVGWAIIGGESGPGARPCDIAWIRSSERQTPTSLRNPSGAAIRHSTHETIGHYDRRVPSALWHWRLNFAPVPSSRRT